MPIHPVNFVLLGTLPNKNVIKGVDQGALRGKRHYKYNSVFGQIIHRPSPDDLSVQLMYDIANLQLNIYHVLLGHWEIQNGYKRHIMNANLTHHYLAKFTLHGLSLHLTNSQQGD
ncbi:hypothetical protein JFN88_02895 [Paenibacillus sp. MAHUQ-46]|uniref:Uncharacterized protein n=1 Tax=Paenibacillus roseus TaxID=2798579 RepID=A0A934IZ00_9BACL|nr:hypothetical protein [Paenibacillus roseus]MBJ6360269.1 hypothetical protein [Paenibacillus roseus]